MSAVDLSSHMITDHNLIKSLNGLRIGSMSKVQNGTNCQDLNVSMKTNTLVINGRAKGWCNSSVDITDDPG